VRTSTPVALAVAGLWALSVGTSSVHAAPWDVGGAVPPSATPRPAQPDPNCTQSYANDKPSGGPRIDFGIGPLYAGAVGERQTPVVPGDRAKADAALARLKGSRSLEVRLNRLFMEDGRAGIRRYRRLARRFAGLGLDVALQVRYHPAAADDGDIGKWRRFVRALRRRAGASETCAA
jgi:hypothetical protein